MRCARSVCLTALMAAGLVATPAAACTIGISGVAFGAYSPINATPRDGVGTVTLQCHPSVQAPVIALDTGRSGTFAQRRMSNGTNNLSYNLYTTAARVIVWGDGTGGSSTVTGTDSKVTSGTRTFNISIYGRIPAAQTNLTSGSYNDSLFATVTF